MKIKLTQKQVNELRPYFDRVQATSALGSPGMLVAQLRADRDGENSYVMIPAFLEPEHAKIITTKGRELGFESTVREPEKQT